MMTVPTSTTFYKAPFSPGIVVSFTSKTDLHDINEILLKVALNTIKQTEQDSNSQFQW
jgi:hypothetical protein